jgi:hypothetical protein
VNKDTAKRDIFLAFLVQQLTNVVDNLITKDELFYATVIQRLMDISSNIPGFPKLPSIQLCTMAKRPRNPRRLIRRTMSRTAPGMQNIFQANHLDIHGMTVIT